MGVLDGIRVLDLGHYIAGPLTAQLLANQGAEVIHIDRPGAVDHDRDAYLQRNKRRLTLDLKNPGDLETALRLAAGADVVVENFRPGVLDLLGLSAETLRGRNPRLVYCSIPGFASADARAGVPGWEGVIAAATGNCRVRFGEAPENWDYSRPTYTALPLASNFAAIVSATAIVAALNEREVSGDGARIEVPLFDATFELVGSAGSYYSRRGYRVEEPLIGNGSGTYECADGRFVQFNPVGSTTRFLTWFLDAAGEYSLISEAIGPSVPQINDPELIKPLRARLTALFLTRSAQEWDDLGRSAGIPLCTILTSAEWLENEHARQSSEVVELVDPRLGPTWMAGAPIRLTGSPTVALAPRSLVGQDAAGDALWSDSSGARLPAVSPTSLTELHVVDLTQILAGPSAGRILAEYGAEVVKVNGPQRRVESHGVVNRGKKSILIDLQRNEGQALLWELIERADVVTQNFPRGTAEHYGIGYQHVRARKPDAVFVSVSCYGYDGPWERDRGYEVQGQAVTGIMERAGRDARPGVLGPYNPLDFGTGAMAGLAAMLGIFHRTRTGEGQHVWTSLAQTGTFHQATMLYAHDGKSWDEPAGRYALGTSELQRFYEATDGWFFLGATEDQRETVAEVCGVELGGEEPGAGLEAVFATRDAAHWVAQLQRAGIGAHRVVRMPELLEGDYVVETGIRVAQTSGEVGDVVMPGPAVILDGQRLKAGTVANAPGSDAEAVLALVGRADDLTVLEDRWVVQTRFPPAGWPPVG